MFEFINDATPPILRTYKFRVNEALSHFRDGPTAVSNNQQLNKLNLFTLFLNYFSPFELFHQQLQTHLKV